MENTEGSVPKTMHKVKDIPRQAIQELTSFKQEKHITFYSKTLHKLKL